ncbi:MAG: secretin N-terminal domain-containing protein [Sterolibacterium sp.]|jgi:general secretion pathway protein D
MTFRELPVEFFAICATLVLAGCSNAPVQPPSPGHLRSESLPPQDTQNIPQPVQLSATLPRPKAAAPTETYSVVVNNVSVQELLFALARDAKINVDIHPGIQGVVTLNAIDQTLQQLLTRIGKQVDLRWELDGPNLAVMPDSPFLRTYKVDYVNMARDTSGNTTVTTQIASTGAGGTIGSGGNNSLTKIENISKNHFWETLEKNLKDILRETDKVLPEGSSETSVERTEQQSTSGIAGAAALLAKATGGKASTPPPPAANPAPASLQQEGTTVVRRNTFREAASVISNPESGILSIRASARQHEKIQEFLDQVLSRVSRQVMIEATIAEVQLSNNYQQGIDWSILPLGSAGFRLVQKVSGDISAPASSIFELSNSNTVVKGVGIVSSSIKLLEAFGTVKVLSSPKLSVINNQTAVLKVIDNRVYFTIKADITPGVSGAQPIVSYTTTLNTVPVGFVMNVTPQISTNDTVLLNIRPSVSRIVGSVPDPNPSLKASSSNGFSSDIVSSIPVIRTREMESMIRVSNGNIAVMGGLMEDSMNNVDNAVPGLSSIPVVGNLFVNRSDERVKTELVVFLRPIVIQDSGLYGDYRAYRDQLPDQDYFKGTFGPQRQVFRTGSNPQ